MAASGPRDGRNGAWQPDLRMTGYTQIDKNIDAWAMGPLSEPMAASRLGAGGFLSPIGRRENFCYKSLQRRGSGVPWGAWLERL
jgi:hypothetical protein